MYIIQGLVQRPQRVFEGRQPIRLERAAVGIFADQQRNWVRVWIDAWLSGAQASFMPVRRCAIGGAKGAFGPFRLDRGTSGVARPAFCQPVNAILMKTSARPNLNFIMPELSLPALSAG
jgi:hypothetical protein